MLEIGSGIDSPGRGLLEDVPPQRVVDAMEYRLPE